MQSLQHGHGGWTDGMYEVGENEMNNNGPVLFEITLLKLHVLVH